MLKSTEDKPDGAGWRNPVEVTVDAVTQYLYIRVRCLGNQNLADNLLDDNDWFVYQYTDGIGYSYRFPTDDEYNDIDTNLSVIAKTDTIPDDSFILGETATSRIVIDNSYIYLNDRYCLVSNAIDLHNLFKHCIGTIDNTINVNESFTANGVTYSFYSDWGTELNSPVVARVADVMQKYLAEDVKFTLSDIFEMLASLFHVYWQIVVDSGTGNKYFRLLHASEGVTNDPGNIDPTDLYSRDWTEGFNQVQFNDDSKPYLITRQVNASGEDFVGLDIEIPFVRIKTNKLTYNLSKWNFDLPNLIDNPKAKGDLCLLKCAKQVTEFSITDNDIWFDFQQNTDIYVTFNVSAYNPSAQLAVAAVLWDGQSLTTPALLLDTSAITTTGLQTHKLSNTRYDFKWYGISGVVIAGIISGWDDITYTGLSIAIGENSYIVDSDTGILSSEVIQNAGFSLANIDNNFIAEMPETSATVNGATVTVDKEPDKEQTTLVFPCRPLFSSMYFEKYLRTGLGYVMIDKHKRKLDGSLDEFTCRRIDDAGGIGYMQIESSTPSIGFKIS
jgi:hypothetical protein